MILFGVLVIEGGLGAVYVGWARMELSREPLGRSSKWPGTGRQRAVAKALITVEEHISWDGREIAKSGNDRY